jgi:hypothetical protein
MIFGQLVRMWRNVGYPFSVDTEPDDEESTERHGEGEDETRETTRELSACPTYHDFRCTLELPFRGDEASFLPAPKSADSDRTSLDPS